MTGQTEPMHSGDNFPNRFENENVLLAELCQLDVGEVIGHYELGVSESDTTIYVLTRESLDSFSLMHVQANYEETMEATQTLTLRKGDLYFVNADEQKTAEVFGEEVDERLWQPKQGDIKRWLTSFRRAEDCEAEGFIPATYEDVADCKDELDAIGSVIPTDEDTYHTIEVDSDPAAIIKIYPRLSGNVVEIIYREGFKGGLRITRHLIYASNDHGVEKEGLVAYERGAPIDTSVPVAERYGAEYHDSDIRISQDTVPISQDDINRLRDLFENLTNDSIVVGKNKSWQTLGEVSARYKGLIEQMRIFKSLEPEAPNDRQLAEFSELIKGKLNEGQMYYDVGGVRTVELGGTRERLFITQYDESTFDILYSVPRHSQDSAFGHKPILRLRIMGDIAGEFHYPEGSTGYSSSGDYPEHINPYQFIIYRRRFPAYIPQLLFDHMALGKVDSLQKITKLIGTLPVTKQ